MLPEIKLANKAKKLISAKKNVDAVRTQAYKNMNNCTSFPKVGFIDIEKKYGCQYVNHTDPFFNFPANPTADRRLQVDILGPNAGGMLDNFYLDPLHNILNKVNLQILSAVKQSIINRGVAQGMSMYTYASNGTVYKYFYLISLSPASPPKKY